MLIAARSSRFSLAADVANFECALEPIRFSFGAHRALAALERRFQRQFDGYRLRTIFPWLFPPLSSLRRCSAKRHREYFQFRIGYRSNGDNHNGINTVDPARPISRRSLRSSLRTISHALPGQGQYATPWFHHS